jgi:hypothetical protein
MISGSKTAGFSAEADAGLFKRAEKELAAFVAAVNTLHGGEQARAAADDWLLELIAFKEPCKDASLDFRSVTIGAVRRLARCLSTSSPANSNSRHPVTQDKVASVSGKHELIKIPTIWADWYAAYMAAEQAGSKFPE